MDDALIPDAPRGEGPLTHTTLGRGQAARGTSALTQARAKQDAANKAADAHRNTQASVRECLHSGHENFAARAAKLAESCSDHYQIARARQLATKIHALEEKKLHIDHVRCAAKTANDGNVDEFTRAKRQVDIYKRTIDDFERVRRGIVESSRE
jgi:hypothetical protein